MEAGGECYEYIPALNASDEHIAMLAALVEKNMQGWDLPDEQAGENTEAHYRSHLAEKAS